MCERESERKREERPIEIETETDKRLIDSVVDESRKREKDSFSI